MKQFKLILVGVFCCCFITVLQAQTPQNVFQGSTQHYHVTDHAGAGYTYSWTISPSSPGNTIAAPSLSSTNITWGSTGTYTITLKETNSAGSCATLNTFQVLVVGIPTLQFSQPNSDGCADQLEDITLSYLKANGTAITGSDAGYFPLQVNYTVDGVARNITFNAGDDLKITLSVADRADADPYTSSRTISVILTGATANSGAVTLGTTLTHTDTVYDLPELNPIVSDENS